MHLIDSSVWIALINTEDSCHKKAQQVFTLLKSNSPQISHLAYGEVITVLRVKGTDKQIKNFRKLIRDFNIKIIFTSEYDFYETIEMFSKFGKLSYADASMLHLALKCESELVTFDKSLKKAWEKIKN